MKCMSHTQFFEIFANSTRLKIIESLEKSKKCVSEICHDIDEEQSKVSHNLKKLKQCHFVESKREGKNIVYGLNSVTIKPLLRLVEKHVALNCKKNCWWENEKCICG